MAKEHMPDWMGEIGNEIAESTDSDKGRILRKNSNIEPNEKNKSKGRRALEKSNPVSEESAGEGQLKRKPGPKGTPPARTQNVPIHTDMQANLDQVRSLIEANSFAGSISERKVLTEAVRIGLKIMIEKYIESNNHL